MTDREIAAFLDGYGARLKTLPRERDVFLYTLSREGRLHDVRGLFDPGSAAEAIEIVKRAAAEDPVFKSCMRALRDGEVRLKFSPLATLIRHHAETVPAIRLDGLAVNMWLLSARVETQREIAEYFGRSRKLVSESLARVRPYAERRYLRTLAARTPRP